MSLAGAVEDVSSGNGFVEQQSSRSFLSLDGLEDYDLELYNITLADDRTFIKTFYTSQAGPVLAATTGTISTVCSLIVIYLIYRSNKGLKTVYHRIMFAMSSFDACMSVAVALATLPMPKNMIYTQFEGLVIGNTNTCTAQGFFFMLGGTCTSGYLMSLMLYYLFSIHYGKTDNEIARRIEPLMHALVIIYGFSVSFSLMAFEAFNPTPLDSWCTAMTLPWWCPNQLDEACLLRAKRESYLVRHILAIYYCLIFLVSIGSLTIIVWGIYSNERLLKMYAQQLGHSVLGADTLNQDFQHTRTIMKQALGYAFVYISVNIFPVITIAEGKQNLGNGVYPICHLLIRPLQGFFNLLIFVYHKVGSIQSAVPGTSLWAATHQVLAYPNREPPNFICSSLSIVRIGHEQMQDLGVEEDVIGEIMIIDNEACPPSTNIGGNTTGEGKEESKEQYLFYPKFVESLDHDKIDEASAVSVGVSSIDDIRDLSGFSFGSGTQKGNASRTRTNESNSFGDKDVSYVSLEATNNSLANNSGLSVISGVCSSLGGSQSQNVD